MKKLYLLLVLLNFTTILTAQIEYTPYDLGDYNYETDDDSSTTTTSTTITTTTTTTTSKKSYSQKSDIPTKKDSYFVRLVLARDGTILLEVSSDSQIINNISLMFDDGFIRPMRRYSNNSFYHIIDGYKKIEMIIVEGKKNIYLDNTFRSRMEKDYTYLRSTLRNNYYRNN